MKFFIYLFASLVLFFVYVRYLERATVFVPDKFLSTTPEAVGLDFEDIYFQTKDNRRLHGWFIFAQEDRGTFLFLHGNAGNIGDRLGKIQKLISMGYNVFIFDYRGYGNSDGVPTEEGMYLDSLAAYDYLLTRKDVSADQIIAYGASLGGAAAIDLATKRNLAAIIIDSSFTNAADMGKRIFPFIPSFLVQTNLDSVSKIKDIVMPKLFIHSVDDEVVPFDLGQKLYNAAAGPKFFLQMTGGHNDGFVVEEKKYIDGMKHFLGNL